MNPSWLNPGFAHQKLHLVDILWLISARYYSGISESQGLPPYVDAGARDLVTLPK
jgi:hypothetical protein